MSIKQVSKVGWRASLDKQGGCFDYRRWCSLWGVAQHLTSEQDVLVAVLAVDTDGTCFQATACLWEAWVTASLDK